MATLKFGKLYRYNFNYSFTKLVLPPSFVSEQGMETWKPPNQNELLFPIKIEDGVSLLEITPEEYCWIKVLRGNGKVMWMYAKPACFIEVA